MDKQIEEIANLIEEGLGWTNGWTIPQGEYRQKCIEIAEKIRNKLKDNIEEVYVDDFVKMEPHKTIPAKLIIGDVDYCVWQTERPDKPCVFVVENAGDYEIYQLDYVDGRLEWVDNYGYLFDDIEDLNYDKYLIIKWL